MKRVLKNFAHDLQSRLYELRVHQKTCEKHVHKVENIGVYALQKLLQC